MSTASTSPYRFVATSRTICRSSTNALPFSAIAKSGVARAKSLDFGVPVTEAPQTAEMEF